MKVAFYTGIIENEMTGFGLHVTQLLRHMMALRPEDEYISFLPSWRSAKQHEQSAARIGGAGRIRPRTIPFPGVVVSAAQTHLRVPPMRMLLREPYDLYHQMYLNFDPSVPRHKLVVSLYDTVSLHWPGQEAPLFRQARRLLQRSSIVLTLSEYCRQSIIEGFDLPAEQVQAIYCGCDHDLYHTRYTDEEVQRSLAQRQIKQPYILYIGGQPPRKNLVRLVHAFAQVRRENQLPHTLVLAGPCSPPAPELAEAIATSGVADAIQLLGYVKSSEVPHLYRGTDVLLFPSLYEGFGLPVVEAMACGTVVVTSNTTALPEVGGDAAIQVDPSSVSAIAEGIIAALREEEAAHQQRIARGMAHAQKFSWARCASEHLAVYDRIVAERRG